MYAPCVEASDVPEGQAAARGGALRAGGFLLGQLLTVGAVALLFRHLGVEDTGRYVTVLSLVAIVQGLTDLGLTTLGVRELSTAPEGARRPLLADLLGLRLAATVAGVALVIGFAAAAGYGWSMVAGAALAGLGLVVQNAGTTLGMDLLVRLRAGRIALADLVRQATAAALIVVGVATGADLLVFFAVLVPAALAGFGVIAISALRVGPGREPRRWAPLLRATIPFAIAAAASAMFFRVAVVEMSLLASERDTGLFSASFRVVEVLSTLPALAVSAIFPVFTRRAAVFEQEEGLVSAVGTTTIACAAAGVGLALGLALGAPAVIQVVAGPDFGGAIPVLRIQGLALAASFVAAPWGFALLSLGREHTLMWVNVLGVGAAAAVGAVLIQADGARGGALATVLGEAGLMVAFGIALARARPALTPALWPLARPLLAGGVGALAFLLPVPAVPMALAGLAAYTLVLAVLGGLPSPRIFRRAT
jgi:O-antigen/teichoic acid export membrane protein